MHITLLAVLGGCVVTSLAAQTHAGSELVTLQPTISIAEKRSQKTDSRARSRTGSEDYAERLLDESLHYKIGGYRRNQAGQKQYDIYKKSHLKLEKINHDISQLAMRGDGKGVEAALAQKKAIAKKASHQIYALDGLHQVAAMPSYAATSGTILGGALTLGVFGEKPAYLAHDLFTRTQKTRQVPGAGPSNEWQASKGPDGWYRAGGAARSAEARRQKKQREKHEKSFRKATGIRKTHLSREEADEEKWRNEGPPSYDESHLIRQKALQSNELAKMAEEVSTSRASSLSHDEGSGAEQTHRDWKIGVVPDKGAPKLGSQTSLSSQPYSPGGRSTSSLSFGSDASFNAPSLTHSGSSGSGGLQQPSRAQSLADTITSKDDVPLLPKDQW